LFVAAWGREANVTDNFLLFVQQQSFPVSSGETIDCTYACLLQALLPNDLKMSPELKDALADNDMEDGKQLIHRLHSCKPGCVMPTFAACLGCVYCKVYSKHQTSLHNHKAWLIMHLDTALLHDIIAASHNSTDSQPLCVKCTHTR
jgi:hypothetical protein